ncbi:MAG: hypothetical protein IKV94_01940 [Clostridia bacterium]|nr:hypothetical protein [Clostridia bacterium]
MVKSVDKIITILGFNEKSKELKELYECRRIISIYDEFMLVISFYGPKKLVKYSSTSCVPFKSEDGADYVLFLESLTGETDIINTINYEKLGSFKYIHSLDDYNHIGRKANGNYVYINLKEWKASKEYFSMYHFMFGESGVFLVENEERKAALLKAETLEQTRFFDCVVRMNSEFALGTIRDKQVIIKLEDFSEAIF